MKAKIVSFRGSHKTKYGNQMIVNSDSVDSKDKAKKLVGNKVIWKSPKGKEIKGEVTKEHGGKGALRVRFEKGMPGQSIGTEVDIKTN